MIKTSWFRASKPENLRYVYQTFILKVIRGDRSIKMTKTVVKLAPPWEEISKLLQWHITIGSRGIMVKVKETCNTGKKNWIEDLGDIVEAFNCVPEILLIQ